MNFKCDSPNNTKKLHSPHLNKNMNSLNAKTCTYHSKCGKSLTIGMFVYSWCVSCNVTLPLSMLLIFAWNWKSIALCSDKEKITYFSYKFFIYCKNIFVLHQNLYYFFCLQTKVINRCACDIHLLRVIAAAA